MVHNYVGIMGKDGIIIPIINVANNTLEKRVRPKLHCSTDRKKPTY